MAETTGVQLWKPDTCDVAAGRKKETMWPLLRELCDGDRLVVDLVRD